MQEAEDLLRRHAETYHVYWDWSRTNIQAASLSGLIETNFGWTMHVGDFRQTALVEDDWVTGGVRETTLQNWPMQANGGDILRVACIALAKPGIRIAFPLHDAVMVECDLGEVDELSREIAGIMENATQAVLGHLIPVDVTVIKPGQSLRGKKGDAMWEIVEAALAGQRRSA